MFEPLPDKFSFPESELKILEFWERHDIFGQSLTQRRDAPRFVFYEGPPTANGLPHPGHCLTRAMKDLFPRYQTMCGRLVERKAGWDTHGLPVEVEVCKEMGIHTKEEIEAYGVEKFVRKCIDSVFRYVQEWEQMTRRLGFWVNLEEAYVTFHQSYVESVWWGLKTLFERGLLYQGHKVVWWWAQGGTALSAGEVGEGYRTVQDPSVYVRFPLADPGSIGVPPVETGNTDVPPVSSKRTAVHSDLIQRRRILPHWEVGGSAYIMTFRLQAGELSAAERTLVLDACRHFDGDRYLLHAVAVMPDHVHLLWTPLERSPGEWWSIADLMHSIKGYTAKALNAARGTTGVVWQREYFDRIIRNQSDFDEKWDYVVSNPERRSLDASYEWVWVEPSHSPAAGKNRRDADALHSDRRDADAPHSDRRDADAPHSDRRDADAPRVSLLVWTTTPWTLVSNHFAAVGPDVDYALIYDKTTDEYFYIASALVGDVADKIKHDFEALGVCKGSDLIGLRYIPPFRDAYYDRPAKRWLRRDIRLDIDATLGDLQLDRAESAVRTTDDAGREVVEKTLTSETQGRVQAGWIVVPGDFVALDTGTGIVHIAPAYGEVDYDLWKEQSDPVFGGLPFINAVKPDGAFNDEAPERYRDRWVKDCDKEIVQELKERGVLLHQETIEHEYPFCPRAEDDPLIQYARRSWFVRTSQFKDEFLRNNEGIYWLPEHIREGRFGDFLRNNVDWALSRERYWGTPLPIWVCEQTGQMEAIGALDELKAKPGATDGGLWAQKKEADSTLPDHLMVHKPYIDEWTYDSPFASGARMRRVPEVIDCWWDAGSMPFAQWGFPHAEGSIAKFADRFPAHFISEALDQTRGWFYGMLAISTLLYGEGRAENRLPGSIPDPRQGHPYKACIVLGLMMGEDGLKMSKRKKNYREPGYIFDHYGADAMRWFFFSGQTPWTSVRFEEQNIRDTHREFLVRLYNVFSFFNIYANIDGFEPGREEAPWQPVPQRAELDRWIISELHRTTRFVRASLDGFENYPAAGRLNEFVDALSNWYVRRSRQRFWRGQQDQDKWDAYHTLYEVLVTLARLTAPFTPFFAETMYQNLCGRHEGTEARRHEGDGTPLSVHLCDYPGVDESLIDEELAQEMELVRQIVSLGRAARTSAKLKVRQPLALAEIILARPEHANWLQAHSDLIAEELNIKRVEFTTEADQYVTYQLKPDFKAIGPRFGKLAKQVAAAVTQVDAAQGRRALVDTGELTVAVDGQPTRLTEKEVHLRLEARPGWSAAQGRGGVVVVKTELTDELRDEGLCRELIHQVQDLRKKLELAYEARVTLYVQGSDKLHQVADGFAETIRTECLATRIERGAPPAGTETQTAKIAGEEATLAIVTA